MPQSSTLILLAIIAIAGGLFAQISSPSLTTSEANFNDILIKARGTNGAENIALYINNQPVQFWNLTTSFKDYIYTPPTPVTVNTLSIHFLNDRWEPQNGINYDVQVDYITVNGTKYESEHQTTSSTGSWDQENWCAPGNKQTEWLHCTGSFTYNVPGGTVVGVGDNNNNARTIKLNNQGSTLDGSTHTFTFSDTGATNGVTRYDIWIDNVDYSQSVLAPVTSITAENLPTDGKQHTITLRPPAGYDGDLFTPVIGTFTADTNTSSNTPPSSGNEVCMDFGTASQSFGLVNSSDWSRWMPDFQTATNPEHLGVVVEGGKGVLRHRYVPSNIGSDRVVIRSDLDAKRTYRVRYKAFFEPGFEWGGNSKQGGKLGFGFGAGSRPSGGEVKPDGFTTRIMWRGNHLGGGRFDGTGYLEIYAYNADRDTSSETTGSRWRLDGYEIEIGKWIDVMFEVRANSSTSRSDGEVRAWVNGDLLLERGGIKWQSQGGTPLVDTLYYSSFYGGGSSEWAPSKNTYIKYKDVCWSIVN